MNILDFFLSCPAANCHYKCCNTLTASCSVYSSMPFVLSTSPCQFSTIDLWLPQMLTNSVNCTTACSNFCRFSLHICTNVPTHTHTQKNLLTYYLCHVTDHFIGCGVLTVRELDLRSMVQILLKAMLRNSLGQVAHSYVPLSPSSITWYRPKGSDAVRLRR